MSNKHLLSSNFSDLLVAEMISVWPSVSKNTFDNLSRINRYMDGDARNIIKILEMEHPIVFQRVRSRASNEIIQGL